MSASESSAVLTVLGSGTLLPSATRSSPAHHLAAGSARILLDAGTGTVHGLARGGLDWRRLTHVVLTHFHTDHIADVAPLMQALDKGIWPRRTASLTILGPPGVSTLLHALAQVHGEHVVDPAFPLRIVELPRGGEYHDEAEGFALRTAPAHHTEEAISVLVRGPWGALGYTGDTGPSDAVAEGLSGSDVLIAECGQDDPPQGDTHLSPTGVAALAGAVRPALLLVTHVRPPLQPEEAVAAIGARYWGRVLAAHDGLRVRISPTGVAVDPSPDGL